MEWTAWTSRPSCWIESEVDAADLLRQASAAGVILVSGKMFYTDGGGRNQIRLSFSSVPPAIIDEDVRRLGLLLERDHAPVDRPATIPLAR